MAREHTIEVKVVNGELTYEQTTDGGPKKDGKKAHVRHNDKVRWICNVGALACLFLRSAFDESGTSAKRGDYTDKLTVKKEHDPNGDNHYKYFAVVAEPFGKPLFEDPEIIVDEDPLGPPKRK